jgi:hypothetical protein
MPAPFRDLRDDDALGLAGFLRFVEEENGRGMRGALFLINSRGEPVDFAFSRVDMQTSFLWRDGDAKQHAVASLSGVLFQACPTTPALLLALAGDVHPSVFTDDLAVDVPICRVARGAGAASGSNTSIEPLSDSVHLVWVNRAPEHGSSARRLLDTLIVRQLITEPFERAEIGIGAAFGEE